jgi:hypothetical protein
MVAQIIFSPEGQAIQKEVWTEVLDVLSKTTPEVMDISEGQFTV